MGRRGPAAGLQNREAPSGHLFSLVTPPGFRLRPLSCLGPDLGGAAPDSLSSRVLPARAPHHTRAPRFTITLETSDLSAVTGDRCHLERPPRRRVGNRKGLGEASGSDPGLQMAGGSRRGPWEHSPRGRPPASPVVRWAEALPRRLCWVKTPPKLELKSLREESMLSSLGGEGERAGPLPGRVLS